VFRWLTERRRKRLLETPFPAEWTQILETNVAAYKLLEADEQQRLRELVQVFIAEKHWEGCGGLELDDEIRVTIAGTGCQLLLGRDHDLFAEVESILIYPSAVVAREQSRSFFDPGVTAGGGDKPVLGLAVKGGAVVLAWDSALHGARDPKDGRNVVIHELAHKIDFLDGDADGTPLLDSGSARRAWAAAFAPAFLAHQERASRGKRSFLDDYAVTNEAEYFAVATEAFFEKPRALARELPDVYAALRQYYSLDLAAR
jgi:MtfA peptidase